MGADPTPVARGFNHFQEGEGEEGRKGGGEGWRTYLGDMECQEASRVGRKRGRWGFKGVNPCVVCFAVDEPEQES